MLETLGGETVAVLAKAEAAPSGEIRGRRHSMLDDSDIHSTRHARALVGGVLAGVMGDTLLYVSGGAEHQGPAGGGPIAIIGQSLNPFLPARSAGRWRRFADGGAHEAD